MSPPTNPDYGDMNAPNITLLLRQIQRRGLRAAASATAYPGTGANSGSCRSRASSFWSDADLAALHRLSADLQAGGTQLPPIHKGKGFQEDLERGLRQRAGSRSRRIAPKPPEDMGAEHATGPLSGSDGSCTACHNSKLQGYAGLHAQSRYRRSLYRRRSWRRCLTTGKGKTKQDLGMMSEMGRRESFSTAHTSASGRRSSAM